MKHFALIAAGVVLTASPASAWGDRGHRAMADIAWTQLSASARHVVAELLAAEPALNTPMCSVGSLEDGATWADCVRSRYRERFADTASWHYVDVSICRPFQLPEDPEAHFVIARYERERALLADRSKPRVMRLEALLWVAHLVGDLHQPLHVADAGDRGGNEVSVVPQSGRYPLNLHAEWDQVLVDDAIRAMPGGVAGLAAAAVTMQSRQSWRSRSPAAWARESWELARQVAYRGQAHCGGATLPIDVGDDYDSAGVPVVQSQLEHAGVRLADALNTALR